MHRLHTVGIACSVAVAAAACGSQPTASGPNVTQPSKTQPSMTPRSPAASGSTIPAARGDRWTSCADERPGDLTLGTGSEAALLPLLDRDMVPVSVIVCEVQTEARAGAGTDLVATEEHASEIAALVAAVRLPAARTQYDICTTEGQVMPWFAVVDSAGRWVRPGLSTDECGKFRPEVTKALSELALVRVATRVIRVVESDAAVQAGCTSEFTDMVWYDTTIGGGVPSSALAGDPFGGDTDVRLCVYDVPANERGAEKPGGSFVRGGVLDADLRAQITGQLRGAGPAAGCSEPTGGFAVLLPAEGSDPAKVQVELDGCQRILLTPARGDQLLAQAGPELIALLSQG